MALAILKKFGLLACVVMVSTTTVQAQTSVAKDPVLVAPASVGQTEEKLGTIVEPKPWQALGITGVPNVDCTKEQGKLPVYIDALTKSGEEPIRRDAALRCLGYAVASHSGQLLEIPPVPTPFAAPAVAPTSVAQPDLKAKVEPAEKGAIVAPVDGPPALKGTPKPEGPEPIDCANAQGKVAAYVTALVGTGTGVGRDTAMLCIARAIAAQSGQPIEEPKLTPPGSPKPIENLVPKPTQIPGPGMKGKAKREQEAREKQAQQKKSQSKDKK